MKVSDSAEDVVMCSRKREREREREHDDTLHFTSARSPHTEERFALAPTSNPIHTHTHNRRLFPIFV